MYAARRDLFDHALQLHRRGLLGRDPPSAGTFTSGDDDKCTNFPSWVVNSTDDIYGVSVTAFTPKLAGGCTPDGTPTPPTTGYFSTSGTFCAAPATRRRLPQRPGLRPRPRGSRPVPAVRRRPEDLPERREWCCPLVHRHVGRRGVRRLHLRDTQRRELRQRLARPLATTGPAPAPPRSPPAAELRATGACQPGRRVLGDAPVTDVPGPGPLHRKPGRERTQDALLQQLEALRPGSVVPESCAARRPRQGWLNLNRDPPIVRKQNGLGWCVRRPRESGTGDRSGRPRVGPSGRRRALDRARVRPDVGRRRLRGGDCLRRQGGRGRDAGPQVRR